MAPAKQNLAIYQGDDYFLDAVFSVGGAPFDISAWTFAAQIRKTTADADNSGDAFAEFDCTIVDGPGGRLRLFLDHAQTEAIEETAGQWDLQGTDAGGMITTLLAGAVTITKEVTRP